MEINEAIEYLRNQIKNPKVGLPEEIFLFLSSITPMINVDLLIKDEKGRTLLSYRNDQFCKGWHIPGGIIRFKEKITDRVEKVALNEIGTRVEYDPIPVTLNQFVIERDVRGHGISLLYNCFLPSSFVPENNGLKEGDNGYLKWHDFCPEDLIYIQEIYKKYINYENKRCRVCGKEFFLHPLLKYENMPSVAQNLPDFNSLKEDLGITLKIYQCSGCGLVQISNNPVFYYKEVIRAAGISPEMKEFRKKQFIEFLDKYDLKNKKILEIGCGMGEYLSIMKECGADSYGIEEKEESVKKCQENGLNVKKGFIENKDYIIEGGLFDGFFTLAFLEHLPNINSVLLGIKNNLKENGVGIVEVPNFDMILREKMFSEFMRDHLFYFTKDSLRTALEINGFEVLEIKEVWHDYMISAIVRKRKKIDLFDFHLSEKNIRKDIEDYLGKFKEKSVGIWGAGHQSFAICSIMNLSNKIKYIVDSAKFKQGKYSPATHIPIVSPENLLTDPVDAIIIIAGSYSEEVAKIVKEKYNKNNVAILKEGGLIEIKNE